MNTFVVSPVELRDVVTSALNDLKAKHVTVIDVMALTQVTDYMVIASGGSIRHMRSLVDHVLDSAKSEGVKVLGVEGLPDSDWILIDLGDVVVHVMKQEARTFYQLERLWVGINDPGT